MDVPLTAPLSVAVVTVGDVSVLLVSVCEPARVATVLSISTVRVLPEPVVSMPVPPAIVRLSLSRSIDNAPPESPWKSRSCAVTWESTYVLIAFAEASVSSEPDTELISVSIDVIAVPEVMVRLSMVAASASIVSMFAVPSRYRSLNSLLLEQGRCHYLWSAQ